MTENKNPVYKHWNGKNPEGKSYVGNPDLIEESSRTSPTQAKYQVANETVSSGNLQQKPK